MKKGLSNEIVIYVTLIGSIVFLSWFLMPKLKLIAATPFVYEPETYNVTGGVYIATEVFQSGWNVTVRANVTTEFTNGTYSIDWVRIDITDSQSVKRVDQDSMTKVRNCSEWFTPTDFIDASCWTAVNPPNRSIDEYTATNWDCDQAIKQWIAYNLSQTYNVTKLRVYTNPTSDLYLCNITHVYISNDPSSWGSNLAPTSGCGWSGGAGWYECDHTDKEGKYINITFKNYNDVASDCIYNSVSMFPEFDAYVNASPTCSIWEHNFTLNESMPGGVWTVNVTAKDIQGTNAIHSNTTTFNVTDTLSPTYSNDATNTTTTGKPCEFTLDWDDDIALHTSGQYIFSTNNTGTWVNASAVNFTSTPETASDITVLNSTSKTRVEWKFYAKDNSGKWNVSDEYYSITDTITGCKELVDAGVTYYLRANITDDDSVSSNQACMNITAENVTLDCQGYTIDGTDVGKAVYSEEFNSTVKNCVISDWDWGIDFRESNNHTVQNVTVFSAIIAFYLRTSLYNTIINNTVHSATSFGILLTYVNHSTVSNNTIRDSDDGLELASESSHNIIHDNIIKDSSGTGIILLVENLENKIYNNFFNNTNNFQFGVISPPLENYWNTTNQSGINIWNSSLGFIGGNYWTNSTGNDYSNTCDDIDENGYCDSAYNLTSNTSCTPGVDCGNNVDYLPIAEEIGQDSTPPKYWDNSTNNTLAGLPTEFRLRWTDNAELSGYIFYFLNGTGNPNSFGHTKKGASGIGASTGIIRGSWYSPTETGTADSITLYIGSASSRNFKCALYEYDDDGTAGAFIAETEERTLSGEGWETFDFTSGPFLLANTNYYILCWVDGGSSVTWWYDSTVPTNRGIYLMQTYGDWPDTLTGETLLSTNYSMFSNYTVWINETWTNDGGSFTGTEAWSNVTKVINDTEGATIKWIVYANDTSNNWNISELFSFDTLDETPPIFSNNQTNTTVAGQPTLFSLKWTDNVELSGYIFSFNNGTNDWISPTGNETSTGWWEPEYAYDDNTGTKTWYIVPANSWSNYLTLNILYPISVSTVRLLGVSVQSTAVNITDIDVYNGSWIDAYYGPVVVGTNIMVFNQNQTVENITKVRIRGYNNHDSMPGDYWIYEVDFSGWVNDTWTNDGGAFSGKEAWSNVTKVINSTLEATVKWRVYANDTSNNWNTSLAYNLTITNEAPIFSNDATNTTEVNTLCNFTLDWEDVNGLSVYIFSTNNSGTWKNASFVSFSGTFNTSWNVTTLNSTLGALVQWKFYANDTYDKWNVSEAYNLTTTDTTPPRYSNNSINSTLAGQPTEFRLRWTDSLGLSGYIFSFYNGTGKICDTIILNNTANESLEGVDLYYDGGGGTWRDAVTFLKFNISSIPVGMPIIDAKLHLYLYYREATWDDDASISRIDNQTWTEGYGLAALKSMMFTDWKYVTGFATSTGWTSLDVTDYASTEHDAGNENVSIRIDDPDTSNIDNTDNKQTPNADAFYIGDYAPSNPAIGVRSRVYSDTTLRPYLNVTFCDLKNDTWTNDGGAFSGKDAWSNVTKVINSTPGTIVKWRVYANDTSNNWNASEIFSFLTSELIPPTYSNNQTNTNIAGMIHILDEQFRNLDKCFFRFFLFNS